MKALINGFFESLLFLIFNFGYPYSNIFSFLVALGLVGSSIPNSLR